MIKSLLISQTLFPLLHFDPPPEIQKQIEISLFEFLWGTRDKVKRKTVIGNISKGGLGMDMFKARLRHLELIC